MNFKYRTTLRFVRAKQGHSAAAKELLGEVIETLRKEAPLSFEETQFLHWGLGRLRSEDNDPFNLNKTNLKGDIYGAVTREEVQWAAYLAVCLFMEKDFPLTLPKTAPYDQATAPDMAAEYLLESECIELKSGTIETYYKKVHAGITRAEAVFKRVQEFDSDFGDDLDAAIALASNDLKEQTNLDPSPGYLRDAYHQYKEVLIDNIDIRSQ